jgi:O-methyltransferase domain/Dimerisation domain
VRQSEPQNASPPFAPLLQIAYGALDSQILCVAAQLGLAERLAQDGPVTADDLASKIGVAVVTVERILRALVGMKVCNEIDGNRFQLTALGEYLRPNHPESVEARVLVHGQVFYPMWDKLIETVQTGEGGCQRALGMPFFEHLRMEPQAGLLFDRTMANEGPFRHLPAVEAYDFGQFNTVVDVGGGNGALAAEILKAHRQPSAVVFDLPRAAASAQQTIDAAGIGNRCRFVGGDAFEVVPGGGDAYLLSNFLVIWQDDRAVIPLRNCRKAIPKNGRVLLLEWVMPAGNEPREGFRFWDTVSRDLLMLSIYGNEGGRVRTRSGFQDLLAAAGFEMTAVIPTRGSISIIEARPV